jgi:hypothetical protein
MSVKLFFILFSLFFKSLGTSEPQTAIVLLQNHHEIRANGGFMGSYAKITKDPTQGSNSGSRGPTLTERRSDLFEASNQLSLSFQDIYVPDGQIAGHVNPPTPIQQAFGQGWYKLRDANWDPNFPTSAKTVRWFLEKGDEINPDLLIAINLSTVEKILKITGPIDIEPLGIILESNNISLVLQNNIQENFFPGSTKKKDLITGAGQALTEKLSSLNTRQKLKIASLLYQDLTNQEILINSTDPKLQAFLEKKDLAGQLKPTSCKNCLSDTVAIIESNLGSNKANAHVARNTTHTISRGPTLAGATPDIGGAGPLGQKAEGGSNPNENFITHQITIEYTNTSPSKNPNPPHHHGGDYLNYLRFYLPISATNIQILQGPTQGSDPNRSGSGRGLLDHQIKEGSYPGNTSSTKHGFQEIGFFHTTPHLSKSTVTISYQLSIINQKSYQLSILKQPGIGNSPQTINLFNKTQTTNLQTDYITSNNF